MTCQCVIHFRHGVHRSKWYGCTGLRLSFRTKASPGVRECNVSLYECGDLNTRSRGGWSLVLDDLASNLESDGSNEFYIPSPWSTQCVRQPTTIPRPSGHYPPWFRAETRRKSAEIRRSRTQFWATSPTCWGCISELRQYFRAWSVSKVIPKVYTCRKSDLEPLGSHNFRDLSQTKDYPPPRSGIEITTLIYWSTDPVRAGNERFNTGGDLIRL